MNRMNKNYIKNEIDTLIEHLWRKGYLTVSRRDGTYLPVPKPVGIYEVDVIAKYKNSYAIGIVVRNSDFDNIIKLREKIIYLASRQTRFTHKPVNLFIGVTPINYFKAKQIISEIPDNLKKNIFIVQLFNKNQKNPPDSTKYTPLFV